MTRYRLVCVICPAFSTSEAWALACDYCRRPLTVSYSSQNFSLETPRMPVDAAILRSVSLGEGDTPLASLPSIASRLGLGTLAAKLEYASPTGSFKDRGTAVVVAKAKSLGAREVVEDSSGNAGASLAAYAARGGMTAHVFVPADAPPAKLAQIEAYGARLHRIDGPRQAVALAAADYAKIRGLAYASHVHSPYFAEGVKGFAHEAASQTRPDPPAHVVIPVGNGSLLLGALAGFRELQRAGQLRTIPRLHAVQAKNVMPIVAAFNGMGEPPAPAPTVAGGIAVDQPARLDEIQRALRYAGGTATAVEEPAIHAWRDVLAREEGVFAELTSAAAFAGLEALVRQRIIAPGESVLVPITGVGLKDAAG